MASLSWHIANINRNFFCLLSGIKIIAPPLPPEITIVALRTYSFTIKLTPPRDNNSTQILGYELLYKPELGDWRTIEVGTDVQRYRIENLLCGSRYQLRAKSYNR